MAFIQKYLIYILLAVIAFLSVAGGIQYARVLSQKTTIAKNEATINAFQKTQDDLMAQVAEYQKNIASMKKAEAEQQKVTNDMAELLNEAQGIKSTCEVDENDTKIIHDFVTYFNAGGVLLAMQKGNSNPKAGGKDLSTSGQANSNRAHWTTKSLMTNLVKPLMEYSLNWEKTGACYEF